LNTRPFLVAAGGTGGHLFPAAALAQELRRRGHAAELATDIRAERFSEDFPDQAVHPLPSATIGNRNPLSLVRTFALLGLGYVRALALLLKLKPRAVIGFGGYPTLPPLFAARTLGIPSAIHEQNAVMGRANRLLSGLVRKVALSFQPTRRMSEAAAAKAVLTGLPVRRAVLDFRDQPYAAPSPESRLVLLIFGGSQGAHFFSETVPRALSLLPEPLRRRLTVVQQTRAEDLEQTRAAYESAGIAAHLAPFFKDLPERIANAHLVIARAGASTVAELMAIGRPSLLVPLPHSLDNHQLENATRLADSGGGWCFPQNELTPERLALELEALLSAPDRLAQAAAKAKAAAEIDAVTKLGDFAEALADDA
jgi:UDP-N-acetylglucosamine--N-acetylmuramyl-(pentapeptide) pyrophosphoryl-undecaprenol N-acetylglucosamine transferase